MKLTDRLYKSRMLLLMLLQTRIGNLLLKLLLCAEMEIRILGQIIQHLDRLQLAAALLAAIHQFVDLCNQLLVLSVDHLIPCYQALVKFCIHGSTTSLDIVLVFPHIIHSVKIPVGDIEYRFLFYYII